MATTRQVSLKFKNMNKRFAILSKIALNKVAADMVAAFEHNSPVDSGEFRRNWDFSSISAPGILAGVSIYNTKIYGGPIEEGSPKGGDPWPSAGKKTVEQDDRIWSKQAVGGVISPIIGDDIYMSNVINEIKEFIFGDI